MLQKHIKGQALPMCGGEWLCHCCVNFQSVVIHVIIVATAADTTIIIMTICTAFTLTYFTIFVVVVVVVVYSLGTRLLWFDKLVTMPQTSVLTAVAQCQELLWQIKGLYQTKKALVHYNPLCFPSQLYRSLQCLCMIWFQSTIQVSHQFFAWR